MINLYKYLAESIFDIDDNIDKISPQLLAQKWIDEQSKSDNFSARNTKWDILEDGSVCVSTKSFSPYVTGNVPKHIKIVGNISPSFIDCNIECLDSIQCDKLDILNVTIEDYGKGFHGSSANIHLCSGMDNLDWLPKKLNYLVIKTCSFKKFDISHIVIEKGLEINDLYITSLKNIKSNGGVYIKNCPKLENVENIECDDFSISYCDKFEGFVGNNKVRTISNCTGCKNFKPINLPKNLENIYCSSMGKDWVETNVMELNPDLKLKESYFPDPRQWKSDIDLYKPGTYVCVKGKSKSYGSSGFPPARGELSIDKVTKTLPSGKIRCENAGLRPAMDVELMRDANPKKNWDYKDPNGINDVSGVGIEVGDEVIVYPKGKSHLEIDKVIGLTKASVRCEKNGIRGPKNICIMRGQKECERLFK